MNLKRLSLKLLGGAGGFFAVTFLIYFFNLDMKLAASLIKPLTAYYNWSKNRREAKKKKEQDTQKE